MARKNKSKFEIIAEMLELAKHGASFEALRARKSYSHTKKYVSLLVSAGLLKYIKTKDAYRATAKGKKLLVKYKEIKIL